MNSEYPRNNSSHRAFIPSIIYDVSAKIASSHQITESERAVLQQAFLENSLSDEEHQVINRIYRAFRLGRLKLKKQE